MGSRLLLLLALALLLLAAPALAAPCGGDFNAFLAAIARDAQGQGVSRAVIDRAFAGLTPDPAVLAFDRRQRGMFHAKSFEFLLNCSRCHGTDAKGSGPDSTKLHIKPVDLTVLAKRNHGRFDPGAVYQPIDGRNARLSHHSAEMPIWGCRHQTPLPTLPTATKRKHKIPKRILSEMKPHKDELNALLDLPCDSEAAIRERLLAIVGYLSLVQEK